MYCSYVFGSDLENSGSFTLSASLCCPGYPSAGVQPLHQCRLLDWATEANKRGSYSSSRQVMCRRGLMTFWLMFLPGRFLNGFGENINLIIIDYNYSFINYMCHIIAVISILNCVCIKSWPAIVLQCHWR